MLVVASLGLLACGGEPAADGDHAAPSELTDPSRSEGASTTAGEAPPPPAKAASGSEGKKAPRRPGERPLPNFGARTLAGDRLEISSLIGDRLLIYFFNPEIENMEVAARAVAAIAAEGPRNNFKVVGVGIGSATSKLRTFAMEQALEFPILDDGNGDIAAGLGLQGPMLMIGVDQEGYVSFVLPGVNLDMEDAQQVIEDELRAALRIVHPAGEERAGELLARRSAPDFKTTDLEGKPFDSSTLAGKPKIVIFFLHTCPHCHKALAFFKAQLAKLPEDKRPALVGISLQNRPSQVRAAMREEGIDFFRVLVDPTGELRRLYGVKRGVPDISMVNAAGEVVYQTRGWREQRDPSLMRMVLHKIAGERVPMLLSRTGYTGNDACVVCHELEGATWEYTKHSIAFDTLVTHGDERDAECVSCHVVGFDEPGGYSFERPMPYLEGVGCESCHGRGGPHISPGFIENHDYEATCKGCHNEKHSLGFDYASFRPLISHTAIAALSNEEREARYAAGAAGHRKTMGEDATFVGSDACKSCHESEYATWASSPHGKALESLVAKQKAGSDDCLRCHTTGFDQPGGFTSGSEAKVGDDLARVGCESCHGAGSAHVAEGARRLGTILSLGDKCDSCVILQICGSCHDPENDPDFEFSVQEHIDRQRHGSTEAGTGKALDASTGRAIHVPAHAIVGATLDALSHAHRGESAREG